MHLDPHLPWAPCRRGTPLTLALSAVLALAACGGGGGGPAGTEPPSPSSATAPDGGHVHLNQAGYSPTGPKVATIVGEGGADVTFLILDQQADDEVVFDGTTTLVTTKDSQSGDYASRADFSALTRPGTYVLRVQVDAFHGTYWDSVPFQIKPYPLGGEQWVLNWYNLFPPEPSESLNVPLSIAAMKYFYYNRIDRGPERRPLADIIPGFTESDGERYWNFDLHVHPPLRANGDRTPAFLDWTDHKFNARNYHWDAGDTGFYPVNTAFFDGLLMEMYEHYKGDLAGQSLNIPESATRASSGLADILSEVKVDAEAMASMLPPPGATVNLKHAKGTPLRLAAHKIGTWNFYPWVGYWDPTLEAFCNFTPLTCSDPSDGSTCDAPCQSDDPDAPNSCQKPVIPVGTVKALPDSCLLTGQDCLFPAAQGWYATHPAPAIPADTDDSKRWGGGARAKVAAGVYDCGSGPHPIYASKPSTAATFAVARYTAQLARLLKDAGQPDWERYWSVAQDAYNQARSLPMIRWRNNAVDHVLDKDTKVAKVTTDYRVGYLEPYVNDAAEPDRNVHRDYNGDGVVTAEDYTTPRGTGPYEDDDLTDDRYAAAVQMYLSALAFDAEPLADYRSEVLNNPHQIYYQGPGAQSRSFFQDGYVGLFDWAAPATLAQLSILDAYVDGRLRDEPREILDVVERTLIPHLTAYAGFLVEQVNKQAYPSAIPVDARPAFGWYPGDYVSAGGAVAVPDGHPNYPWGSNKQQAYAGIILLRAADFMVDPEPARQAASRVMDYLLGTNPLGRSFITGFGRFSPKFVHHRAALFAKKQLSSDPPAGWLLGGPMNMWRDCGGFESKLGNAETATPRFNAPRPTKDNGYKLLFLWNPETGLNDATAKENASRVVAGVTAPYMMRGMAPDTAEGAEGGWCSTEVTGDWNAGLAYFAYALQKQTACSWSGQDCP